MFIVDYSLTLLSLKVTTPMVNLLCRICLHKLNKYFCLMIKKLIFFHKGKNEDIYITGHLILLYLIRFQTNFVL